MSAETSESSVAGAAYGVLAALIWGGFAAITKLSMASHALNAWDVTAVRFATAGLLILPLFVRHGFGSLSWRGALFLAIGAGAPYVLLTAGGLAFAPAAHMGVITPSCMLLVSTVGSWALLGGKPSADGVAGALTIFAGILMLGWDGLSSDGSNVWLGDAMFVLGGVFWASYTLATRAWGVPPLQATVVVAMLSMLGYVPFYAAVAGSHLAAAPWKEIALQAVFQGVLSAVVALVFYTRSVALLGAARGAVFGALVPSFSLLFAIPILGEIPTRLQIVGVIVVTSGMLLVLGLYRPARWRRAPQALGVVCLLLAAPSFAQRPSIPPQTIAGPQLKVTVVEQRDAIRWPPGIEVDQLASAAIDARGHLLLLNRGKEAVLEFDERGAFVRSFGAGLFQRAHSLTVDARGHYWITDVAAHVVLELDAQGAVVRTLGTSGKAGDWDESAGTRFFNEPTDIAFARDGSFFVTQGHTRGDPKVLKFDAAGRFVKQWGGRGALPWQFEVAHSIVIDSSGLLYVADRENRRIVVFDQNGEFVKGWVYRGLVCSLAFGPDGVLYMTSGFDGQIAKLDANGRVLGVTGRSGEGPNEYGEAHDLAVARDGAIYVTDVINKRLTKLVPAR
jgi:drug/metabolite transporter (DMT)-like permease/DNA-binding beta-propeller fold protein YncE